MKELSGILGKFCFIFGCSGFLLNTALAISRGAAFGMIAMIGGFSLWLWSKS